MSKQRIQKDLRKLSAKQLASGLPLDAQPHHVAPIAIAIKDKLTDARNHNRAINAARMVAGVFDRSIGQVKLPFSLGCGEGCSSCCHVFTSATAPEIFAIVKQLRSEKSAAEIEEIESRCAPLIGKNVDDRFGAGIPCPLLVNDRCSVYENRPIACRQCASTSREVCESAFAGGTQDVPYSGPHMFSGSNAKLALHSALEASGMKSEAYELGQALKVALSFRDPEAIWLSGNEIFSECQVDGSRQPEYSRRVKYIADTIR